MFKLNELLKVTSGRLIGQSRNTLIKGISIDSRSMLPGQAFLALKGDNFDGHDLSMKQ